VTYAPAECTTAFGQLQQHARRKRCAAKFLAATGGIADGKPFLIAALLCLPHSALALPAIEEHFFLICGDVGVVAFKYADPKTATDLLTSLRSHAQRLSSGCLWQSSRRMRSAVLRGIV
jgi:hypothetical protein